jgi:uncharacterized protein YcbK (DUF882 family)
MEFHKLRFVFILKVLTVVFFVFLIIWYIITKDNRKHVFSYFDTGCVDYKQKDYSRKLNDKIVDYSAAAKLRGIRPCKDDKEIRDKIRDGKLVKVNTCQGYVIDRLTYSYPCVTEDSRKLLDEISDRLQEKTSQMGLKGVRFIVTSLTRKTESMKSLRRNNKNASANSPHLYGNAFDISYKRFIVRKWVLTNCDKKFLKDALGEVIWQLKEENKCWATYEKNQSCFHVVAK